MTIDHYEVLGVPPDAAHTQIRAAYRRLMREHHPDLRPHDLAAEIFARQLTAAWTVLGRPSRRAVYDRTRSRVDMGRVVSNRPSGPPAYSPDGAAYRRAFHLASVRVGALVFAVGLVVLAAGSL